MPDNMYGPQGPQTPPSAEAEVEGPLYESDSAAATATEPPEKTKPPKTVEAGGGGRALPPAGGGGGGGDDGDDEEEGMLRMSFLDHLAELRSRILKALGGLVVAFFLAMTFAERLWNFISDPALGALRTLHYQDRLVQITPMEGFTTVWLKVPLLASIFIASPWILYQVWAFVAPGLYRKERRWAAPFVISAAGLFILGGVFAYFIAFRFALVFLLGIGRDIHIAPMVSVTEYFDLFVNVMLGIGLVFELPVLIFFLTLLRIVSPGFLVRNSRYAILIICIVAAVVTPTPDVFNMMLFAVPMCALFYVGIFAGYLVVLRREHRRFPWGKVLPWAAGVLVVGAAIAYWVLTHYYGYHAAGHWPFLVK